MLRVLVVEFDGTRYCGWQSQRARDRGRRAAVDGRKRRRSEELASIQETLEGAIERLAETEVPVTSCSRTDAGVHALGMVCAFDETGIQCSSYHAKYNCDRELVRALNTRLPNDIAVRAAHTIPRERFNIHQPTSKTYMYLISSNCVRPVLGRQCCWHIKDALDVGKMRQFAEGLVGVSADYSSFACARTLSEKRNRRCTIHSLNIEEHMPAHEDQAFLRDHASLYLEQRNVIKVVVRADRFLHHMMRILVSTLVEIGRGRLDAEVVQRSLASRERLKVDTAPAHGLTLVCAKYDVLLTTSSQLGSTTL